MLGKKFCPKCGSEDVMMVAGGITGTWMCKKCGFSGSIFPEKELIISKPKKDKEIKNEAFRKKEKRQILILGLNVIF